MVLIIEHVEGEGPHLLLPSLGEVELCRTWRGDRVPDGVRHRALVVMGGHGSAWDEGLQPEAQLMAAYARAERPVLGICLGAQLLARGLGARNFRGPALEKGVYAIQLSDEGRADPLVGHLDGAPLVQWHHDSFDLPPGAMRLASSAAYLNQAFRVGVHAYGIQFHIECGQELRRDWEMPPGDDASGVAFARAFAALVG